VQDYAQLEREFKLHLKLNKRFQEVLDIVCLNENGRVYFWPKDIGYINSPTSVKKMVSHLDLLLLNVLRKKISDVDNSRKEMYNFIEALTKARISYPISHNVPIIVASLLTHFFSDIPLTSEGHNTYNVYFISGDTPCVTSRGILHLCCYDSYEDCLQDVSEKFQTAYDEEETFLAFRKKLKLSLTLYRIYFILTLLFKQGVCINGEDMEMDSYGRFSNSGSRRDHISKRLFERQTDTISERPREA